MKTTPESGPRRHLAAIKMNLDEVLPLSLEEWDQRIAHTDDVHKSVAFWLSLSERYQEFVTERALSLTTPAQRKDVFRVFLAAATHGRDALRSVSLSALSVQEAEEVRDWFLSPNPHEPQQTDLEALVRDLAERVAVLEAVEIERRERIAELEALQQQEIDKAFRVIDLVRETQHVFDARAHAAEAARAVAQLAKGEH